MIYPKPHQPVSTSSTESISEKATKGEAISHSAGYEETLSPKSLMTYLTAKLDTTWERQPATSPSYALTTQATTWMATRLPQAPSSSTTDLKVRLPPVSLFYKLTRLLSSRSKTPPHHPPKPVSRPPPRPPHRPTVPR